MYAQTYFFPANIKNKNVIGGFGNVAKVFVLDVSKVLTGYSYIDTKDLSYV